MEYSRLVFDALSLNSPIATITLTMEGRISSCNPAFEHLFGYTRSEVIGNFLDPLISTSDNYYETSGYTKRSLKKGETVRITGKRKKKDKTLIDVEIQAIPLIDNDQQEGLLILYHDITDRVRAETSMHDLYSSFVHIMDSIDADVYVADMDTYEIIFMNQHMRNIFGGDYVGKVCWNVFRNETGPCSICTNKKLLDDYGNPVGEVVWEGQNPITKRWYKNFDRAIAWGDGRTVRLEVATDITDIKETEQRLYFMATHDPLTKLPNRMYFLEKLTELVRSEDKAEFAVAFLDLDNFKGVNDKYGHNAGDQVLVEASKRMKSCLREQDVISRVSGDEFTLILTRLAAPSAAAQVIQEDHQCRFHTVYHQ